MEGMNLLALVKYTTDDIREIVPVSEIKNFHPVDLDDFERRKTYKVLWPRAENVKDDEARHYYDATILRLAEKEEDFNRGKRIPAVPKSILFSASDSESNTYDSPENGKNLSSVSEEISCKARERIKMKRKLAFSSLDSPVRRCDETNVVEHNFLKRLSDAERELKNCKEEFARKEHAYEETIQKLEETIQELKETIQELKEKLQDSTERESMCQTELFILQQELKQKEKLDLLLNLNLEIQQKIIHKLDGQQPFSPSTVLVREGTHDHDGIEIGAGISISERGWARIKSHASASLFVKDLAALIWDESVLREKSVTGRKCPTVNGDAKPPLTPQKVEVINDTLRKVLRERGVDSSAIEKEIKSVNRYLREKINDLQRKFKKHCRSTVNIELQQRTMEVTDANEAPKEQ